MDYSDEERAEMARDGRALPDGSYPIATCQDLRNAVQAYGRETGDAQELRHHIAKRKAALGCPDTPLPESWRMTSA